MVKLDTATRRKQIMETSLEIIKQGGIQSLTIKSISKQIGISEQAIYRHFDSKIEILVSLITYFNQKLKNSFEPNSQTNSAISKIKNLTQAHMEYLDSHPAMAVVIFGEEIFQNDSTLAKEVSNALNKRIKAMTKIISKGQNSGEIKNNFSAENIAFMFLGSLRLLATTWRHSSFSFSLSERGNHLLDDLVNLIQT